MLLFRPSLGCYKVGLYTVRWDKTYCTNASLPGGHVGCVSLDKPGLHPAALRPGGADWHWLQNSPPPSFWRISLNANLIHKLHQASGMYPTSTSNNSIIIWGKFIKVYYKVRSTWHQWQHLVKSFVIIPQGITPLFVRRGKWHCVSELKVASLFHLLFHLSLRRPG